MCGAYKPVVVRKDKPVGPLCARDKRQPYKDTCTTVACLPPIRGLEKCRVIGLVAWPAPFSQSQASTSVFLFPEEHG